MTDTFVNFVSSVLILSNLLIIALFSVFSVAFVIDYLRSTIDHFLWLSDVLCGCFSFSLCTFDFLSFLRAFVAMGHLRKTKPIRRALPGNPKH